MSDFFSSAGAGFTVGILISVIAFGGLISKCSDYVTESKLADKHCQHLESRTDFAACRKEFLK